MISSRENPGLKVSTYSSHALERMGERGVTADMVETIVAKGQTFYQEGGRYLLVHNEGAVVLSREGTVITTWGRAQFTSEFWEVFWTLGFK